MSLLCSFDSIGLTSTSLVVGVDFIDEDDGIAAVPVVDDTIGWDSMTDVVVGFDSAATVVVEVMFSLLLTAVSVTADDNSGLAFKFTAGGSKRKSTSLAAPPTAPDSVFFACPPGDFDRSWLLDVRFLYGDVLLLSLLLYLLSDFGDVL